MADNTDRSDRFASPEDDGSYLTLKDSEGNELSVEEWLKQVAKDAKNK